MLFRYTNETFCPDIIRRKIKPERSNISRYDPTVGGMTGLSIAVEKAYVRSGPGSHFSKAMEVKKGEKFYLVLNNVYGTETPFRLVFAYYTHTEIEGIVKAENGDVRDGIDVKRIRADYRRNDISHARLCSCVEHVHLAGI